MNKMTYVEKYENDDSSMYDMDTTDHGFSQGTVTMTYSPLDSAWTEHIRGTVAVKMKDNGNGVKIKFENGKKIKLDYSQVQELFMLLKYYNEDSGLVHFKPSITKLEEKVEL